MEQPNGDCPKLSGGAVARGEFAVARSQATPLLDDVEVSLNDVAPLVVPSVEPGELPCEPRCLQFSTWSKGTKVTATIPRRGSAMLASIVAPLSVQAGPRPGFRRSRKC